MLTLLRKSHVIVDGTQRRDASKPVIPNEWLAACQPDAVLVDLSVDPYTLDAEPPVVKGIEGIPQGNLDQYVFEVEDPKWKTAVPASIPSRNRRKTISCYSWPGIYPRRCMRLYGQQLLPLMRVLNQKAYDNLSADGPYFERALYRARLDTFLAPKEYKIPEQTF
jgi:alanine dehydrogenase